MTTYTGEMGYAWRDRDEEEYYDPYASYGEGRDGGPSSVVPLEDQQQNSQGYIQTVAPLSPPTGGGTTPIIPDDGDFGNVIVEKNKDWINPDLKYAQNGIEGTGSVPRNDQQQNRQDYVQTVDPNYNVVPLSDQQQNRQDYIQTVDPDYNVVPLNEQQQNRQDYVQTVDPNYNIVPLSEQQQNRQDYVQTVDPNYSAVPRSEQQQNTQGYVQTVDPDYNVVPRNEQQQNSQGYVQTVDPAPSDWVDPDLSYGGGREAGASGGGGDVGGSDDRPFDPTTIVDRSSGLADKYTDMVYEGDQRVNPYDTRRDAMLEGPMNAIDRAMERRIAEINHRFANSGNLGSPAYDQAMMDLQESVTAAKYKLESDFAFKAADMDDKMYGRTVDDMRSGIDTTRGLFDKDYEMMLDSYNREIDNYMRGVNWQTQDVMRRNEYQRAVEQDVMNYMNQLPVGQTDAFYESQYKEAMDRATKNHQNILTGVMGWGANS